ncbi:MAG TPA: hypothetical protein VKX16_01665 [Chloroflexota bacterium]|nr:hypothetical protein [Chloroflexota bacterium]
MTDTSSAPVRVVPVLIDAAAAAPTPAPRLTYRGGPLLTSAQVFAVYWGAAWQQSPLADIAGRLNQFFDYILGSSLLDSLGEYSVPGQTIGHGRRTGSAVLTTSEPGSTVDDAAVRGLLQNATAAGGPLPAPGADALYFVFTPPGTAVTMQGSQSCQSFCGYHDTIAQGFYYAVMPYPGCAGCLGSMADFDALTVTVSHELCESITDPVPGHGWYDDANGEIGDICAWQTGTLGSYTVQLEWSNARNACGVLSPGTS